MREDRRTSGARCWAPFIACVACAATAHAFIELRPNMTLVPIPEVITDPNIGVTAGAMGVVLISDEQQQIRHIIAPDVRYNSVTGAYPMFRWYLFPDEREQLRLQAGKGTELGEYFELIYEAERLAFLEREFDVRVRAFRENDPFERFFGFGNDTTDATETNYTADASVLLATVGVRLPFNTQALTTTRWRVMRVHEGGVSDVTQLITDPQFVGTPGIDGATAVGQTVGFRYDSRDFSAIPTEGHLAAAGVEIVDKALGSSASYIKYALEGRSFIPLRRDKRFIWAAQGVLDYIQGGDRAPFYERSQLGGVRSLRGFGSGRFVDNHRCFARSELRSNVWEPAFLQEQFHVRGHVEVAPFVELGQVFNSSRTFPLQDPHVVGGVGFRAVVAPQVVAFVDVGSTGDSPSVFTGVDYPF
jgi:outer membrane protein assembly factor BamA